MALTIKHGSTSSLINHLNLKHDIQFDKNEIDQIEKPSVKDEESYDDLVDEFFVKEQGLDFNFQEDPTNSSFWYDISHRRNSIVWKHFLYNANLKKAKCKHCDIKPFATKGGNTSALLHHLRQHNIFRTPNEKIREINERKKRNKRTFNIPADLEKIYKTNKR